MEMSVLQTPILCVVIGEGASGGAIGIGIGDRLLMLENAWFGVISPESCSAILWGDSSKKQDLSETMKITATDLFELKIIDRIIREPLGGAHWDAEQMYRILKGVLAEELEGLNKMNLDALVEKRLAKVTSIGQFAG
jgi:acetyl-CoA carboxylase carboxyl transferase subunit alpha